jgi:S-adenosylmethionine-diacylgycerolhomoserine-N-methlytransferase
MMATDLSDAERMDRHYRYQRFIYDLTRTHYLIGRKHLIADLNPKPGETVLEIGCGTAWNLIRVAQRYPNSRIYGVDVSNAMLDTARAAIRRSGLAGRISVAQADATNLSVADVFGISSFDRVFFSYVLSMMPGWQSAIGACAAHVAPGGSLHIVDFGQCDRLPRTFKAALFAFLDHYTVTPRANLEQICRQAAETHELSVSFQHFHRGYTDYAVLRRLIAACERHKDSL